MNTYKHNMKTTIKFCTCMAIFSLLGIQSHAQVGIGIANPHPSAILDMTNTDNKRVVMPRSSVMPTTSATDTVGMLIYYNNGLYLRDSTAFTHVNPWKYKYNGKTQEELSFNPTGLVGVGIGINLGTPTTPNALGYLHVSATGKDVLATGNSAALFIGNTTSGSHMIFDADEIMVKTGPSTAGTLKLQEGKGSLQIGQNIANNVDTTFSYLHTKVGSATAGKTLTVHGNINAASGKVKEGGNDLLPSGSIIMWSGTTVPAGWKICDGTNSTPNLLNRMIYGGHPGSTTPAVPQSPNYNTAQGSNSRSLTIANIPNHIHKGDTDNGGGAHSHTDNENARADNDDNDGVGNYIGGRGGGWNNDGGNGNIRPGGSEHNHDITTDECLSCAGSAVDMRSAYYVLAFIMKI